FRPVITRSLFCPYFKKMRIIPCLLSSIYSTSRTKPSRFKISAISFFIFEAGTSSFSWRTMFALRMRVSISATGSLIVILLTSFPYLGDYQLAFLTPGICPLYANSRKQIRQSMNLRYTECGRPQRSQRVYSCTLNFALRFCLATIDFLAMFSPPSLLLLERHTELL